MNGNRSNSYNTSNKYTIEPDEVYGHMYYIRYPDGQLSAYPYNLTWATEHYKLLNNISPYVKIYHFST